MQIVKWGGLFYELWIGTVEPLLFKVKRQEDSLLYSEKKMFTCTCYTIKE